MIKIALVHHINFNHLSLSFKQRTDYIAKYLEKILDAIIVKTNISICTEDLLLLKVWNPKVYRRLINHPKVNFLFSTHNHAIPLIYPETFTEQMLLGSKVILDLINPKKIQGVGYPSEVDFPLKISFESICKVWEGIILGESRIKISGLEKDEFSPVFTINDAWSKNKIRGHLSRRAFNYRDYLHKYIRDEANSGEMLLGIQDDYKKYAQGSVLLARIDLEVILFNAPIVDGIQQEPPINKFRDLQKYLINHNVDFLKVADLDKTDYKIPEYRISDIAPCSSENIKWNNKSLKRRVENIKFDRSNKLKYGIWLSLQCSDYYCTNFQDLCFSYGDKNKKTIFITKTRIYRDQESGIKLKLLQGKTLDQIKMNDNELEKYMQYFMKSNELLTNYL